MLFVTLSQIVGYLISVIIILVIVQFVISLLFAFNVVSIGDVRRRYLGAASRRRLGGKRCAAHPTRCRVYRLR